MILTALIAFNSWTILGNFCFDIIQSILGKIIWLPSTAEAIFPSSWHLDWQQNGPDVIDMTLTSKVIPILMKFTFTKCLRSTIPKISSSPKSKNARQTILDSSPDSKKAPWPILVNVHFSECAPQPFSMKVNFNETCSRSHWTIFTKKERPYKSSR